MQFGILLGVVVFTADGLTVLGLVLDILGVVLLFAFAPEKFPDPQFKVSFAIKDGSRQRWRRTQRWRRCAALAGVSLLVTGFSLQAVAVFL